MSRTVMKLEIRWLVRLALDQNLLQLEQCRSIYAAVGPEAELMDFAQKIIDDGLITDVELLEKIAGIALTKAQKNTPVDDPLDAPPTSSERLKEAAKNARSKKPRFAAGDHCQWCPARQTCRVRVESPFAALKAALTQPK